MTARPVHDARARVAPYLDPTPLRPALGLDPTGGLTLKLESFQPTGSFKVRGAFSRLTALDADRRASGVVAASTGNHGAAVAYAARRLGIEARVVVPVPTPDGRVRAIQRFGASVTSAGAECGASEVEARRVADATGATFVSPYNDPHVMQGQGTLALELADQAPDCTRLYVAVGGGGLVGGICLGLGELGRAVEVVGCSPAASCPMEAAVRAGRVVDVPHAETLSLATAGALEEGTVTLEPCTQGVHRWVRIGEDRIAASLRRLYAEERILAEGAVGVALAAWEDDPERGPDDRCCVVVCGGNLDPEHLFHLLPS
ncbi:MAG: pyridoxal-phosphate dependent enzyme [Planctomycetota bacterium]